MALTNMPLAQTTLKAENTIDLAKADTQALIDATCSQCHRHSEPFPPNFLAGNHEQVQRKLKQCAARIAYRLHMWHIPENTRNKTPMPPTLPTIGQVKFNHEQWLNSSVLTRIKNHVLTLIDSPFSDSQLIEQLLKTPYEKLEQCNITALNQFN